MDIINSRNSELIKYGITIICLVAAVTDMVRGKIFNWLTIPAVIMGVIFSTYLQGMNGFLGAILGSVVGLLCYGWMFGLRIIGGGDVKLLMALGAWGGARYSEKVALLAVVLGGTLSLVILVLSGKIFGFIRRMYFFLRSLFIRELELELPKVDKSLTMPFGIPISVAALWIYFADPFLKWGITLWP